MRFVLANGAKQTEAARRERHKRDHAATQTLRSMFPEVARVRLELIFADESRTPPAAQAHEMSPSAKAFFRFPCPAPGCDGQFDLDAEVASLLRRFAQRNEGEIFCTGARIGDRNTGKLCGLQLRYRIDAGYLPHVPIVTAP